MTTRNYRRFPLLLLAAIGLVARAAEVQRMQAVEFTGGEYRAQR